MADVLSVGSMKQLPFTIPSGIFVPPRILNVVVVSFVVVA